MVTIKLINRGSTGKPDGMSAKQWEQKTKLLKTGAFKSSVRVNINRVIRKVVDERMSALERKRLKAVKNWNLP